MRRALFLLILAPLLTACDDEVETTRPTTAVEAGVEATPEAAPPSDVDLSELGVPVPDGVRAKKADHPMVVVRLPNASQATAALVTELTPAEVRAFYEEHLSLDSQIEAGDALQLAARLPDGGHFTARLGTPKDGLRDFVVMVVRPTR